MKIFILEDDSLQILRLKLILESIQPNLVIQTFKESDKLLQHITQPDENNIYLLDIELKNSRYGGFEVSQRIREIDNLGTIIFITTHSEFMRKTYEYRVAALDFIDKIQTNDEIKQSLVTDFQLIKERQNLNEETEFIELESNSEIFRIPVSDIYFFETITDLTKRKLSVYTKSQHFVVKGNLKSIETKSDSFMRVHRSFVANVNNIKRFDSSDFLPEDINSIRLSNKKVKDKGHKKVAIEIEKINTKSKVARVRENNHITGGDDKGVTKGGVGQGDSFGTAYDGRGHRGGSSTGNNFGYGDRPGENGPNNNDDMFIKNRNSQRKITNVKYRCIEVDHQSGMYRLMVKPDKSLSNVRIDLDVIGDSGKKDTVQITKATYRGKQLNIGYSNVYIQSLLAGSWQPIMIKLNGNTRLKLEVEIYANI